MTITFPTPCVTNYQLWQRRENGTWFQTNKRGPKVGHSGFPKKGTIRTTYVINGVEYLGIKLASEALGVTSSTLSARVKSKSEQFKDWKRKE